MSERKRKSKNCKHNTWPSRYLWIPEKNIFGKVYHFGEIVFQKSSKIMIFPSCVIKNRDQKKSQNSGMTFLVFLNIFFTISMYQLKKKFCGYIHLKAGDAITGYHVQLVDFSLQDDNEWQSQNQHDNISWPLKMRKKIIISDEKKRSIMIF